VSYDVPQRDRSPRSGPSEPSPRRKRLRRNLLPFSALSVSALVSLALAPSALAANPSVGLGTAASFSVLAGSTVTNTGPTTMFGDLGLYPGSSVTGAPHVLGVTHVDDAVSIEAKNALTTAYNDAASRPPSGSAGTELAGQTFTAGVRTASSSLLLSSGSVTLDAQGDPNAVFIFQIGSTLTTGSNTSVSLINGAQACNVFWQVGSSATLGTGTRFVGTVMASASITANTAATIHGRLLASTAAVTLDTNTITNSNCASSVTGTGGGTESSTPAELAALNEPGKLVSGPVAPVAAPTGAPVKPAASRTITKKRRTAKRHAPKRRHRRAHTQAHPAIPGARTGFTG
jgi:hypothetical protein